MTRLLEQQPEGAANSPMKRRSDPNVNRICVPQPVGLSTALVRNWSPLSLNRILNLVSDP